MISSSSSSELPARFGLQARRLSVQAGGVRILSGIDLALRGGELVALLGPSGCGKSTLLRALSGFRPADGSVRVHDVDLYGAFERLKRSIGYVPQDDVLHASLTVEKTLRYAARLRLPDAPPERLEAEVRMVTRQVDLMDRLRVRVRNLSGGQRKRVCIAVELIGRPRLMFLDEPTSGLDPALEEQMMALFRALTGPERLTVVTTHVLASMEHVDLAVMLSHGRLAYIGAPGQAAEFFEVEDLPAVYRRLSTEDAAQLEARFLRSSHHQRWVVDRMRGGA